MKSLIVGAALAVMVSGSSRTSATIAAWPLDAADIEDALTLGRFGQPAPYLLRNGSPSRSQTGPRGAVFAAIYTPFVRIAFASRQAWDAGHTLQAADVPASLIEPVVYVAFAWLYYDADRPDISDPIGPPAPVIGWTPSPMPSGTPHGPPFWRVSTPPIWSKPGAVALKQFGAPEPFDRVAAIAAFPLSTLRQGHAFVIYKEYLKRPNDQGLSAFVHAGAIPAEDLPRWR